MELARKAPEIAPDCADAYVLLAEETAATVSEARDLYERGVAAGERALGEELFRKEAGHFWAMLETRPYMRARAGLAICLWELGEREGALDHWVDMLRLNPADSLGCDTGSSLGCWQWAGIRWLAICCRYTRAIAQHHGCTAGHCARSGERATAAGHSAVCGRRWTAIPICPSICWGSGLSRAGFPTRSASGIETRPSAMRRKPWPCGARVPARFSGLRRPGGKCSPKRRRCTRPDVVSYRS